MSLTQYVIPPNRKLYVHKDWEIWTLELLETVETLNGRLYLIRKEYGE